jgi:hypothetical protein
MFVCRLSKRRSYNHRSSSNTSLKDIGTLPASDRIAHGLDLRHCGHIHLPQPLLAPLDEDIDLRTHPEGHHDGLEILKIQGIHGSFGQ